MSHHDQVTIEMSSEDSNRLRALAESLGTSQESLAQEAVQMFLDVQDWQVSEIQAALDEVDRDPRRVTHEAVTAWMRSWGTDQELPRPTP